MNQKNLDLSWLNRRLAWEVKVIKLWEFVLSIFGVHREYTDVSKLNKVLGVEQVGKHSC